MGKKFKTNELTSGKMAEVLGSIIYIQAWIGLIKIMKN
jgi:hypothetical protein